ncbi:MAG: hypothetical protein WBM40_19940 [Thiohalocapsa sp.]
MFQELEQRSFVHRIDGDGRISFVNGNWLAFAAENDWPVTSAQVLGTDLLASVSEPRTRHVYGMLIERVRKSGQPVQFRYRCDAPDCRRLLEMHMHYDRGLNEVEFRSTAISIERRESIALLDVRRSARSSETLSICSWCKAVQTPQAWVELEQAVVRLGLFAAEALPRLSHGICPDCSGRMQGLTATP